MDEGSSFSGDIDTRSGWLPVPSGIWMNASVTFFARSDTEARTFRASAVPASHRCAPISLGRLIGTLRHDRGLQPGIRGPGLKVQVLILDLPT